MYCICYTQSTDRDCLRVVLCKPQILALRSQSVDCPCVHPCNIRHGHTCIHWLNEGCREAFNVGWEKLTFLKEGQEQCTCTKKEPGKRKELLFALSHSSNNKLALCLYYYQMQVLCLISRFGSVSKWPPQWIYCEIHMSTYHPQTGLFCLYENLPGILERCHYHWDCQYLKWCHHSSKLLNVQNAKLLLFLSFVPSLL